jgi:ABC-type Mn2+/Zn2+ transport system ATPase subunit
MSRALVTLDDVDLGHGRTAVATHVHLVLREGEILGIVGPNGSGKTTLLRTLLGLTPPLRGQVEYGVARRALRFGYVPQRETMDTVFPLTALDVVLLGRYAIERTLRLSRAAACERAREALALVGAEPLAERLFRDLSGGQQQRVLVARALAVEPRVLLLDEPTNGLDLDAEQALVELIAALHRRQGLTIVIVSHVLNVVVNVVESLALMTRGSVLAGPLDAVLTPQNLERVYGGGVVLAEVDGRRIVLAAARASG